MIKLTQNDKLILNSYIKTIQGLGDYLGSGYEFVLHSLENLDNSVIAIINGHYSNRKVGAPITDLALKMLSQIENSDISHQYKTYFNRTKSGVPVKSSTIPITGDNDRIIGLLCINFYLNTPVEQLISSFSSDCAIENNQETFVNSSDDLIHEAIKSAKQLIDNNPSIPTSTKNKEIIGILQQRGIFNLKDAVIQVANELRISKNTVYLHIRNIQKSGCSGQ